MKKIYFILILFPLIVVLHAQDYQAFSIRSYLGVSTYAVFIAGNFDGNSHFPLDNEVVMVPKLSPGYGFGIIGGFRFPKASLDFCYKRTAHSCSFVDNSLGEAAFNVIKFLGVKLYAGNSPAIKPFFDIDLSGTWMRVTNASFSDVDPDILGKASFGAIIFGLGAGLALEPGKHIGIEIEVLPAWYMGTDVKGILKSDYEVTGFNSFKFDTGICLIYYFKSK
jgi:hypothetical protein